MATLILGTVGRVLGGPIGGLAGTLLGGIVDRAAFGAGSTREGPRVANLAVQSAAYGEPLPRVYGRMRVAGTLVWTAGIKETRTRNGGGKGGPATNTYSYSSSFAVIVSGRPIVAVERIWADGKLLRARDGTLNYPAIIRTHLGSASQPVDPLIAAAEGKHATAYRGRSYLVFEDLPLADYGNRIPNLTFEVVGDIGPVGIDTMAVDVGAGQLEASGTFPAVSGFAAAQGGSIRQTLTTLAAIADLSLHDNGSILRLGDGAATVVPRSDLGASARTDRAIEFGETRGPDSSVPDAVWLTYADVARDYQAGVQAAVRSSPVRRVDQREVPLAATAAEAKLLAQDVLRRAVAARTIAAVALPWRYAGLRPGDLVGIADDSRVWRVTRTTVTGAVVELELRGVASNNGPPTVADAGRVLMASDIAQGATEFVVLDLPSLPGPLATAPQLTIAASGRSRGWRRADILISRDDGASYAVAATVSAPAVMGTVEGVLRSVATDRWDRRTTLTVALFDDSADLQTVTEAAVLAGANLAAVGDEIIQFAEARALGGKRFELRTLLRGRRGSEQAARTHVAGERFVLLDDRLLTLDLPLEVIGMPLVIKAAGPGDNAAMQSARRIVPRGAALRPLSPAALRVSPQPDGDVLFTWLRRSRSGFAWNDGIDVPLAEDTERYRLEIRCGHRVLRAAEPLTGQWRYAASDLAADHGIEGLVVAVAQVSAEVGCGDFALLDLPS